MAHRGHYRPSKEWQDYEKRRKVLHNPPIFLQKLTFGKYKGMLAIDVQRTDLQYFNWACNAVNGFKELADAAIHDSLKEKKNQPAKKSRKRKRSSS